MLPTVPVIVVALALLYMVGMTHLEGTPRTFWESLVWTAETLTSTGYGHDSHWNHPVMALFVVGTQFVGLAVVIVLFPLAVLPFFETYFEKHLPHTLPNLDGYALIYRHGPAVDTLLDELDQHHLPAVILEEDDAIARRARERGREVVLMSFADGDPNLVGIDRARAIIANGQDQENAAMIVSARLQGFKGPIYAFVEKPSHRRPMVLAGATAAYTPRHILAAALAAKASERIAPRVAGLRHLGEHLQIAELRIQPSSELAGKTLRDADIRGRTHSTVLGHWGRKSFVALPHADLMLEPSALLLVVGSAEAVQKLGRLATPLPREGAIVVCGYGEVGHKVTEMLRDAGEEVTVIERRDLPGVDVVGDALDPEVLRRAAVADAKAIVLALDSGPTLFATTVIRDLAPDVTIIARVNHADNVAHVRHAGADFAMSISEVAAQIVAQQLLGEHSVSLESDVKLTQVGAVGLVGKSVRHTEVAERTGCVIVAVERGDAVVVEFGDDFRIAEGDTVYICGTKRAVARYLEQYPQSTT